MKNQSRATAINGKMHSIRQFLADLSHHSPKMDGSFTGAKAPFFHLAFNTTGQDSEMQRDFIIAITLLTNKPGSDMTQIEETLVYQSGMP